MRNVRLKVHRVLGKTLIEWNAIKNAVIAFLDANDAREDIPEAEIRAVHADLVNNRIWNEIKKEIGLS